jgi:hypothetical protein
VILRLSEAHVRRERLQEFLRVLGEEVRDYPDRHAGLLAHDVLVREDDEGPVVVYMSRWREAGDVERFAGPQWRSRPVVFPDEDVYLRRPLQLTHFEVLPAR